MASNQTDVCRTRPGSRGGPGGTAVTSELVHGVSGQLD